MEFSNKSKGVFFISTGIFLFAVSTYWLILSKLGVSINLENKSLNKIIKFIETDDYYCTRIPAIIPITFIFMYIKWIAWNYFVRN